MTYARAGGMGDAEHIGGSCTGSGLGVSVSGGHNVCVSEDLTSRAAAEGCVVLPTRCVLSAGGRGREVCCPSADSSAILARLRAPAAAAEPTLPALAAGMPEWMPSPFAPVEAVSEWVGEKASEVATTVATWTGAPAAPGGLPGTLWEPGAKPGMAPGAPVAVPGVQPPAVEEPTPVRAAGLMPGGTLGWIIAGVGALVVGGVIVTALMRRGEE